MAAACLFSHASALGVISKEMRHRAGHDVHEHPLNLSSFLFSYRLFFLSCFATTQLTGRC